MKKKSTKQAIVKLLIYAAVAAVLVILGLSRGIYTPERLAEGERLNGTHWLSAFWGLITGIFAGLAASQLADMRFGKKPISAGVKLAIFAFSLALAVAGVVFAASALGVDVNAIVISLGIIGTCVAIGFEPLMYDVMGGLGIISGRDFEVGDIVTLDGFRGEVLDISLRAVKLMDAGGNIRTIRNSDVGSVVNLSEKQSTAVVRVPFNPEAQDLEAFEQKLTACLKKLAAEKPEIFPSVPEYKGVDSYSGDSAELLVVAKVSEEMIYEARRALNRAVILLKKS